jgi:hypothetical protein
MSDALMLGFDAVDLLLSIAETPAMAISGAALNDFYNNSGSVLVAAGAIKPDDFEAVAVTEAGHDDAVVSLTWSSELGGYAYFSSANGLVRIDESRLRRFKLDISWFLQWIGHQLGLGTTLRFISLIPDRVWDLGEFWLGDAKRMRSRTAIYLSRRLTEPETVRQLAAVLSMHLTRRCKVILATSNDLDLARTVVADACAILPIKSCARAGVENFELDLGFILRRTDYANRTINRQSKPIAIFVLSRLAIENFAFRVTSSARSSASSITVGKGERVQ